VFFSLGQSVVLSFFDPPGAISSYLLGPPGPRMIFLLGLSCAFSADGVLAPTFFGTDQTQAYFFIYCPNQFTSFRSFLEDIVSSLFKLFLVCNPVFFFFFFPCVDYVVFSLRDSSLYLIDIYSCFRDSFSTTFLLSFPLFSLVSFPAREIEGKNCFRRSA